MPVISSRLQNPIGIVNDPSAQSCTASDPHAGIQVLVPFITRFEVDVQPEFVICRTHGVGSQGIEEFLERLTSSGSDGPPALGVHGDMSAVVCLEQIVRVDVRAEVRPDDLIVLSARNHNTIAPCGIEVPAFEANPVAVASSRSSTTVGPMGMRSASLQAKRKSCSRLGTGSLKAPEENPTGIVSRRSASASGGTGIPCSTMQTASECNKW